MEARCDDVVDDLGMIVSTKCTQVEERYLHVARVGLVFGLMHSSPSVDQVHPKEWADLVWFLLLLLCRMVLVLLGRDWFRGGSNSHPCL